MKSFLCTLFPELERFEEFAQGRTMLMLALRPYMVGMASFMLGSGLMANGLEYSLKRWLGLSGATSDYAAFGSFMLVALLFMMFLLLISRRNVRRSLRRQLARNGVAICVPCGYDLRGADSDRCPECGTVWGHTELEVP